LVMTMRAWKIRKMMTMMRRRWKIRMLRIWQGSRLSTTTTLTNKCLKIVMTMKSLGKTKESHQKLKMLTCHHREVTPKSKRNSKVKRLYVLRSRKKRLSEPKSKKCAQAKELALNPRTISRGSSLRTRISHTSGSSTQLSCLTSLISWQQERSLNVVSKQSR